jgi:succinoglycan biosynthesis protein ExoM
MIHRGLEVSVIMCTCARRELAHTCIASVVEQRDVDPNRLELVIVDNSPSAYFREDAAAWADRAPFSIVYVHEPVPNIARARNAGCRAARGEFVAFIDDDERAEPDWLARLLRAAETWQSDGVCGALRQDFDGGTAPTWDPDGLHFQGCFDLLPPGTPLQWAYSGNLLLRRRTCLSDTAPFDVRYGQTGGEDTAFTYALTRGGRSIVWSPDAVVHEFVPRHRMEMGYHLWRRLATAQISARVQLQHDAPVRATLRGTWLIAKGLGLTLGALPAAITSCFATEERLFSLRAPLFTGLGLALWPIPIKCHRERLDPRIV